MIQKCSFQNDAIVQFSEWYKSAEITTHNPKAAEYAYKHNKLNSLITNVKIFSDFRENSLSDSLIKKSFRTNFFPSCGYQEIYIILNFLQC